MILIDTHILLWFQQGNASLNRKNIDIILNAHKEGNLFLSAISLWEIAMLEKLNRIALHQPLEHWLNEATQGISIVSITPDIAIESVKLPNCEHRDPADRFIIATARTTNCAIMTQNQKIIDYAHLGHVRLA